MVGTALSPFLVELYECVLILICSLYLFYLTGLLVVVVGSRQRPRSL